MNFPLPQLQPRLTVVQGIVKVSSLALAEGFEKQHKNVLQVIDNLECSKEFHRLNFQPMIRVVEVGKGAKRHEPYFEMTRDGFMFVVMGFTGKKAAQVKEIYIGAFNAMEAELARRDAVLRQPGRLPPDIQAQIDDLFPPHLFTEAPPEFAPTPAPSRKRMRPGKA